MNKCPRCDGEGEYEVTYGYNTCDDCYGEGVIPDEIFLKYKNRNLPKVYTEEENLEMFLIELKNLMTKWGVTIEGCGCCSPHASILNGKDNIKISI